jgi:hypothetical protein
VPAPTVGIHKKNHKKMIRILQFLIFLLIINVNAQELKIIQTEIGDNFDFSIEKQKEVEKFEQLMRDLKIGKKDWENMSSEDTELFEKYGEVFEGLWAVGDAGCSWYCGAGNYSVKTSSNLKSNKKITYISENLSDFSYKTAWIEGVKGYGVGEYIEFSFTPTHPRLTTIIIANGYVKSKKAWRENSRVQKLKMYVNNEPYAIIKLEDVYAEQSFVLDKPLGYSERKDFEKLKEKENWTIKFEILSVYKGEKYDDTAITEIYFDGLDVHCLTKGTLITMSDNSQKPIELLEIGDKVLSFNQATKKIEISEILNLANPIHKNLIKIDFKNGMSITSTKDHPILTANNNWTSFTPNKTETDYELNNVVQLKIGTEIKTLSDIIKVSEITEIEIEQETYTIVELSKNNTFIANGIIVGIEKIRMPTMYNRQ